MENDKTSEIRFVTKKKIGETQINNSISIENIEMSKIVKVLTIKAEPNIERVDCLNFEAKISGFVMYDLLVVLEDNSINTVSQKSPFLVTFESKEIVDNSCLDVKVNVVEINNVSSEENLNFNSVLNFQIFAINNSATINCPSESEDIFVKTKEIGYSSLVGCNDYSFQVSFDETKDSRFNRVLFATSNATIKNIVSSNNYFVVNGDVFTTIIYQNEDGIIKSVLKENEFSEEIEMNNITKESVICARVITDEIEIVENVEGKTFNFTNPMMIKSQVFERKIVNSIVDAYSLKRKVNLTTTSFEDEIFNTTKQINGSISTSASLDEKLEPINRILSVVPNSITIINQVVKTGQLMLEGIVNINIIYCFLDEEGTEVLNSFDVDVPYSLQLNIDEIKENDFVVSDIAIRDINIKNKLGKELEIYIDFKINYTVSNSSNSAMVTNVSMGEEKEVETDALEIYLTQDEESLWDIAKKLNTTVEDLTRQNEELVMPLQPGEKIVCYRQNVVDFE